MALQIDTPLPTGFVATYWKIVRLDFDFQRNEVICTMGLYKDQLNSSLTAMETVTRKGYEFRGQDFLDILAGDARAVVYSKISANDPTFKTATNV